MLNLQERSNVLHQLAVDAVPETVDIWPSVMWHLGAPRRHSKSWMLSAAVAAGLVALLALTGLPWWSTPEAVNAETILDRAETAASGGARSVSTYHLIMTRTAKDAESITSEVWFGGPDRQRTIQQTSRPNGVVDSRQDVVFNGPDTWIEQTQGQQTRVVHTTGTTWTKPADSPTADGNLTDLLRTYGDNSCMAVQLEQSEASVAGQATYVIVASPKSVGCDPAGGQSGIRANGQPAGGLLLNPARLTVWVDKRSFLPLKTEVRDPQGVLVDRSEATNVQYDVSIPDSTFVYRPQAGVQVATFSGGDGADVKRQLNGQSLPAKSP
jgi:outer membrane lipoprotein-sorting protein